MNLLHNRTFRNLWAASTISKFGTMFGALSLTALIYLDASPAEMGLLTAAASSPVLIFALVAGVWVDRLPRVPVMVIADLGRFAILMTVPIAALVGSLHIEQLYVVSFVAGTLSVLFDLAFRSTLPILVPRDRLIDANSALRMSESVAATASPAIGGAVVQSLGGPVAVLADAVTYLLSGLFISRTPSPASNDRPQRRSALAEALEGFRFVTHQPVLRAVFGMVATYSFFGGFILTLYGLWVIEGLGFSALTLGILLGSGSIGSLVGAGLAGSTGRRLGLGRSITVTYAVAAALLFLTPLAGGPTWLALMMLLTEEIVGNTFWTIYGIHALSMRQTITPNESLGRVNAVFLFGSQGLRPFGAVVAGLAAGLIGVQVGLLLSASGISAAVLWLVLSPLRTDVSQRG
ncbi:MAG: MFS transporter [Chloroflexi bacterium]|nr:MFS transporter [Chloroflexota bacterium]